MTQTSRPKTFKLFAARFPELAEAHQHVGRVVEQLGPLDVKTCELIKMGICIGAGLESAFRNHVRRATQHGAGVEEIEQALLLAMNTCGFPRTVAAWQWAMQQIERDRTEAEPCE
jgi:alkylhydroperoxidase/carboxymuconolactone decarboxylase family protein YurZ